MTHFITDQSGAVTVDWVVLTASLVGLGLAAMAVVSGGVQDTSSDVATHLGSNHIRTSFALGHVNFTFDDVTGMSAIASAYNDVYYNGAPVGWDIEGASRVAHLHDGYAGVASVNGGFMMDMDSGSAGNVALGQTYEQMRTGETYSLSMSAADASVAYSTYSKNSVEVYFGGELVGLVDPVGASMENFNFDLVGGSGDGTNHLSLVEVGSVDQLGTYLDNVVVQ